MKLKLAFCLSFCLMLFLASCQQEEYLESNISGITTSQQLEVTSNDTIDFTVFEDLPEYEINEEEDFASILPKSVEAVESKLFSDGWKVDTIKSENCDFMVNSRAVSVRTDTVWQRNCIVVDSETQLEMYFKAKFGSKMVNAINAKLDPSYRISTGTTYCCEWQLMGTFYNLNSNESFAMVDSPFSGLYPDTRTDYWSRGYKVYTHESSNGRIQKQLHSYRVRIINKDVKKPTIMLNIYWPAEILDNPCRGYQFIYRILTRS